MVLHSACSTPVQCHLLLESPNGLPTDLQRIKPIPQHASWGSARSAPHLSLLRHSRTCSSYAAFLEVPKRTNLYLDSRPLHMLIPLPSTSLLHLANCSPSFRSPLRHTAFGNPSPTPRSLGRGPPRKLSGSVCPYHCTNIVPFVPLSFLDCRFLKDKDPAPST